MKFRTLRLSIALAVTVWILVFFVPLVPYKTQVVCSTFFCPNIPASGFLAGYNSLGLLFFHWGASLDISFGLGEYIPPIISLAPGNQLTTFGVWMFILFPITLFVAALLLPEEWRVISAGRSRLRQWRNK